MERQDHINEIFESTKGMQKAEPSPFLFEQIMARIANGEKGTTEINPFLRWGLATLVVTVLSLNVLSIIKTNTNISQENATSCFNSLKTYNY